MVYYVQEVCYFEYLCVYSWMQIILLDNESNFLCLPVYCLKILKCLLIFIAKDVSIAY
jgi:hypothetical protein